MLVSHAEYIRIRTLTPALFMHYKADEKNQHIYIKLVMILLLKVRQHNL